MTVTPLFILLALKYSPDSSCQRACHSEEFRHSGIGLRKLLGLKDADIILKLLVIMHALSRLAFIVSVNQSLESERKLKTVRDLNTNDHGLSGCLSVFGFMLKTFLSLNVY